MQTSNVQQTHTVLLQLTLCFCTDIVNYLIPSATTAFWTLFSEYLPMWLMQENCVPWRYQQSNTSTSVACALMPRGSGKERG